MGHEGLNLIRQHTVTKNPAKGQTQIQTGDFVLEKSIFEHVFEKDIRRVFIYRKAEQLAKAVNLVSPAFKDSVSLKNRIDKIAVKLVDVATIPPDATLSRELLVLLSILSIARLNGTLSSMNADILSRETGLLIREIASYEEPRISIEQTPTLAKLAKEIPTDRQIGAERNEVSINYSKTNAPAVRALSTERRLKGHEKDNSIKDRQETILAIIRDKGRARIKDISLMMRGVSEKTIQRELIVLIKGGFVQRDGERRWSTYSLTSA